MYKRNNGRTTYKSGRRTSFKKTGYQNYKGRNKGNVSQQYNKYLKLAKESSRSGDRIQSEYYYQFTDHYYRLMVELGINLEESAIIDDNKDSSSNDESNDNQNLSTNDSDESNSNDESIESIPFIAEPSKDKRT